MADSFFGFDPSLGGEDGLDGSFDDEEFGEEENYNALNEETFGSEAPIGDWEQDHEKLAQLTESRRTQNLTNIDKLTSISQCDTDIDVESSLSHLVLDEKEGIVPKPGVWDGPLHLPISKPPPDPKPSLISALKNVCTVEELERGLIANRSLPNSTKPPQFFDSLPFNDKIRANGVVPAYAPMVNFQPPFGPRPMSLMNARPITNQLGNLLKYPPPYMYMPPNQMQLRPNNNQFYIPHPSLGMNVPSLLHRQPEYLIRPPFIPQTTPQRASLAGNHHNQNKQFHYGDRQSGPQPFFKNNQYPPHNQNYNNQKYNNHQFYHGHHSHSGHNYKANNGIDLLGEYDEYAGLMSNREKQWLNNIQLLQLNTNQPYIDDYYFTVFCDRMNKKGGKNNNNNGYHRDQRDRDQPQHTFTKVVYTPTQFENSLGKLQCGSVMAPRKLIDMDVVPNSDPNQPQSGQQKDIKKTRQLLLEIERMYMLQLKIEDLNNPLALKAEQQRQQQQQEDEEEKKEVKKTLPELVTLMLSGLFQLVREDKFSSMLSIRKGKKLFLRFLRFLSVTEYKSQLGELWSAVIRGLAIIGRRDSHLLINFYCEFRRWLETVTNFSILLSLARGFMDSANQPSKSNSLTFAVSNKFGVSVISSMLEQAEELLTADDSLVLEWSLFIVALADSIGNTSPVASPYEPIAANTLNVHLNRIEILKIDKYAHLELFLTDKNPAR